MFHGPSPHLLRRILLTPAGILSAGLLDTQAFLQRSTSTQSYLDGLPGPVAALTDTVLKVDGTDLPVHRAILAINSSVFADLFAYALSRRSKTTTRLEIPLVDDDVEDVRIALGYLYRGCAISSSSALQLKSCDDAKSLVKFAHKYSIRSLLDACETYLVNCLQHLEHGVFFTDTKAWVDWTALAEECELDTLLAHCELFMINDKGRSKLCHTAMTSDKISRQCLLRMLRGLQLRQRKADDFITGIYDNMAKASPEDGVHKACKCIPSTKPNHSVSIAKLRDWKK